jgi:hypothetical protein
MIEAVDEVLRQLLLRELPIENGEVDIQFHQPKRAWSARLNRPTINLFLYDVRENEKLRHTAAGWDLENRDDGTILQRRRPFRADLHYLITAWANEPEDEHSLLGRTLLALFRVPEISAALLPAGLQAQPAPISLQTAQYDTGTNLSDVWNAMDNELRPAIVCVVTVALNPYQPVPGRLVRTRELRVGQAATSGPAGDGTAGALEQPDIFWTIGGILYTRSDRPAETLQLTVVERGVVPVSLQPEAIPLCTLDEPPESLRSRLETGALPDEVRRAMAAGLRRAQSSPVSLSGRVVVRAGEAKGEMWRVDDSEQARAYDVVWRAETLTVYRQAGRFAVGNLRAGRYTLKITSDGRALGTRTINVPTPDFAFDLDDLQPVKEATRL